MIERLKPRAGVPDAHVARDGLRDAAADAAAGRRAGVRRAEVRVLSRQRSRRMTPTIPARPELIRLAFSEHGQDTSSPAGTARRRPSGPALVEQLAAHRPRRNCDRLYGGSDEPAAALPSADRIAPLPATTAATHDPATGRSAKRRCAARRGRRPARRRRAGQPARLRPPEGDVPGRPGVAGKTLFQIHAEKVLALARRYGGRCRSWS